TNFAPGRVNSDIRMITSTDGINFANDVEIVAHDSGCSGCGDEVWPDSVFRSGNNWYLYYSGNLWNIYLATLSSRTTVTQTVKALDLTNKIITALAVPTTPTEVAVFLPYQTSGAPWTTRIRTASLADPATMSGEVGRYDINSVGSHQLYYLDESSNQWLMFYQTSPQNVSVTNIGMMTVDVSVQADTTPPAAPTDLQAQ
ncbi:MAG: hypothetical protein ACE5G3_11395, partial [Gammaproteobacteria bacterium]